MTTPEPPKISTEKRGHLLLIGFDRPKKMNAFDIEMLKQLSDAYGRLEDDAELRCGVVFAHGEHFTAGLDLANVAPHVAKGEFLLGQGKIDPWGVHGQFRSKPTVVAVHGRCFTLGIELCLAQDVIIASDDARFAQIEIKRGIFPFGGATFRLVSTAGWQNAMRWLLTGDEFDAKEAHRIGLVQEIVPRGKELERAIAVAETIAAQAPLGVAATLASARRAVNEEAAARALLPEIMRLMATEDAKEGLMSFSSGARGSSPANSAMPKLGSTPMARLGDDIFLEATKEPAILRLPAARYLALDGSGNPESGAFEEAVAAVYGVAYAARAALRERGVALKVSPLEALWWTPRGGPFADPWSAPKEAWRWKVLIRVPRTVGVRDVAAAKDAVVSKRGDGPPRVVLLERIAEGRVVQLLHLGGRASEPRSISKMRALMAARGLAPNGRHHEIYLGDPRRTRVERLKTILRQPVK